MLSLTTDLEWAPESAIEELFGLADEAGVPLFPFVTHYSPTVTKRLGPRGVHPNFLLRSTHGCTEDEVIKHVRDLVPDAVAYRSHCYYDSTRLQWKMLGQGFKVDSNQCAFLQDLPIHITPGGLRRIPVYWSDDIHFRQGRPDCFDPSLFDGEVVRVVVVHPLTAVRSRFVREMFRWASGRSMPFESLWT